MSEGLGRVAVIGGGPAGVCAVKCCVDEGLVPTCYEQHDDIGVLQMPSSTRYIFLLNLILILLHLQCRRNLVLHNRCPSKSGSRQLREAYHKQKQRDVMLLGFSHARGLPTGMISIC